MTQLELKELELLRLEALIDLGDLTLLDDKAVVEAELRALRLQETGQDVQALSPDDLDTGTLQVETATVVGTITGDGNASVTITSAHMTGSPKTISVAVLTGDDPAAVAGKARTALLGDSAVTNEFTVSGTGAEIILTEINYYGNDATLNIASDNDTCTGLTAAATSANTTAGVAASDTLQVTAGNVYCSGDEEGFTLELPSAVSVEGQKVTIKKIDSGAGAITVSTYSTEKIDGADTYSLSSQYDSVTVGSDGTNWYVHSKISS